MFEREGTMSKIDRMAEIDDYSSVILYTIYWGFSHTSFISMGMCHVEGRARHNSNYDCRWCCALTNQ